MRKAIGIVTAAVLSSAAMVACDEGLIPSAPTDETPSTDDGSAPPSRPDASSSGSSSSSSSSGSSSSSSSGALPDSGPTAVSIGGSVVGLRGAGLILRNGAETLALGSDSQTFQFPTEQAPGSAYAITVEAQPSTPTQTCAVERGSGTVGSSAVSDVLVTCTTSTYTLGGTLVGLNTGGQDGQEGAHAVVLANGEDEITVGQNGTFTFPTRIESGAAFEVSVKTNPTLPSQTCVLEGGSGTVIAGDVSTITVNCSTHDFSVGGHLSGASGTVVLRVNGGEEATLNAIGAYSFATPLASGSAYSVEIVSQPETQTCTIAGAEGTVGAGAIESIDVTCVGKPYPLNVEVTGFSAAATPLILQNSGGDDLSIDASGTFVFPTEVRAGDPYAVTILQQPTAPWQTCSLGLGAEGTLPGPNTTVHVSCARQAYRVAVNVSGLPDGASLQLQNNGGDALAVTQSGISTFATPVASGEPYAVTVAQSPLGYQCSVAAGTGSIGNADVQIEVTCEMADCVRLGWKQGAADWTCPAGFRMPTVAEYDLAAACVLPADTPKFNYYNDVAVSVGGCNCKWNGGWCAQPSIETIRQGRACGDFEQLHICLAQ